MYEMETIQKISQYLFAHRQTIAVAESVTSGHLQAALSLGNETTSFFQGGITAYNIFQKYTHLHVAPAHAVACNCVSEKVAEEMAENVCGLFSSDWGIGITGYAAIIPDSGMKELFACYAIAFKGNSLSNGIIMAKEADPFEVQVFYANALLHEINNCLQKNVQEHITG
jgi:PncC family amidohydrolase